MCEYVCVVYMLQHAIICFCFDVLAFCTFGMYVYIYMYTHTYSNVVPNPNPEAYSSLHPTQYFGFKELLCDWSVALRVEAIFIITY